MSPGSVFISGRWANAGALRGTIVSARSLPPASSTGFTHIATWPLPSSHPKMPSVVGGEAAGQDEKEMMQPVSVAACAGREVVEGAADVLALGYLDGAAQQDRRHDPGADRLVAVDLALHERDQPERALRVADEDDAPTVVLLLQVGLPGVEHVGVRLRVGRVRSAVGASPIPMPDSVTCRYIGANSRHTFE